MLVVRKPSEARDIFSVPHPSKSTRELIYGVSAIAACTMMLLAARYGKENCQINMNCYNVEKLAVASGIATFFSSLLCLEASRQFYSKHY